MLITIIILVLSAVFFVNGKIRSDLVALCALVALLIFQILTPDEALSGFSNSVVIMMVGLFVVGGAIFQTGLAKMISSHILKLAGKSELKLFLLVMLVTSAIGAFVSNTGTVALMLPIVVSLAVSANMNPSRLLMPLAFASSMGGMMTLIGTPPNLVIQNALTSAGFPPLSFFSFFPVGIICVAVGTLVLLPLSKWFLSKRGKNGEDNVHSGKSLKQLVKEYGLSSNLFRLRVVGDSRLHGKTIIELDIRRKYGLNILEVRRGDMSQHRFLKTITQKLADPGTVLQKEDILYVTGDFEKIKLFAEDYLLEMLDEHTTEEAKNSANSLDFYDIGIAEIVLMPSSNLINQTIKGAGFRDKFNVNVLGIRRKKEYLLQDLGNERIHSGDVLLVQGTWNNIARLSKEDADWVVLGQPLAEAAKVTLDYKAPVAAVIMVLMVAMMVFDFIPVAPVTAVMIAGILMVLTGCFRNVEAAYKTINWESIVLIAAMLPMSLALEKTGASEYISNSLVSELGTYGPLALMAGIYFTTSLMTMFISNTATAVLLAPIAMQSATQIGVSPVPFLFAVTLGASMCFASPFSTPPNALVMPAGQYTFMDYVKVGLPLQIIMGIVMVQLRHVGWPTYYHLVSIGLPKQTMFIVGIGIGYLCYRKMKVNLMVLIVTTLSLYLLFYSLRHSNVLYAQYASMTEKLFTIPIICLVLFKIKPYVSYLFNCLQWMGKYTLEIYVLHLMIKHLLFLLDVNGILMAFVSIISSIILAPYVNRITNNLTTRTMQLLGVRI